MSDALDKLIVLNTAYRWLNGAKTVANATKVAKDSAKAVNDMARNAQKGDPLDGTRLEMLLGAVGRDLAVLGDHWASQARDVQAAADADWPAIPTDALQRHTELMALELCDGTESPAFAGALDDTVKCIERYREKVVERASYCSVVAEQAVDMEWAYLDAAETMAETFRLLDAASNAFGQIGRADAATAMTHTVTTARTIGTLAIAVAKAYRALADAALVQGAWQRTEQAELDVALDRLYRMQGEEFLRDAGDFLKGVFKAA